MKQISGLFILFFCAINCVAQVPANPQLPNVVPPTPDAQSLGKFGDVPVGLFTGLPNISIPFYEMKVGNFKLPISISYHASGVKVEEVTGSVGLGWALEGGGTLSRSINGLDDHSYLGFPITGYKQPDTVPQTQIPYDWNNTGGYAGGYQYYYAKKMADGEGDAQPDLFFYNFPGQSGKFYIDQNSQIHTIGFSPLKFDYSPGPQTINITDLEGNKYFFYQAEASTVSDACGTSTSGTQYLSKIILANKDSILFDYDTLNYSYKMHGSIARVLLMPGEISMGSNITGADCFGTGADADVTAYGIRLKSIISSKGQAVEFKYTNSRSDLTGTKSLDSIIVKFDGTVIKTSTLHYSYFTPSGGLSGTAENNRLRLDSVKTDDQVHKFTYNSQQLPGRLSYAQDHWGFYNGKTSNTTLLAKDYDIGFTDGADREVDTAYVQSGILKKITYPTGGHTLFDYEPNDYHYTGIENTYSPKSHYLLGSAYATVTDTFTIPASPTQILNVNITMRTDPVFGDEYVGTLQMDPPCIVTLSGNNGFNQSWQNVNHAQSGFSATLTPGFYTMTVQTDSNYSNTYMKVEYQHRDTQSVNKNVLLGGLRIRKISSYSDSLDTYPIVKAYKYIDKDSIQFSSGSINFKPKYTTGITYTLPNFLWNISHTEILDVYFTDHKYYKQVAQPVFSLGSIHGGSVGYTNVETWEGPDAENGKTVSKFSFTGDYGGSDWAPLVPTISRDWESGYLTEEAKYKKEGSNFILLQKNNNYYSSRPESEFWNAHFDSTTYNSDDYFRGWGISIGYKHPEFLFGLNFTPAEFKWNDYHYISKWVRLDSTQSQIADQKNSSNILTTKTKFTYNNPYNLLATTTKVINSKGDTIQSIKRYPHDAISALATEAGLAKTRLQNNWQIGIPLEEVTKNNSTVTYTQRTNYKRYGTTVLPDNIQTADYSDALETRINFNKYDSKGNLIEVQKTNDVKKSYVYDYLLNYPVAECAGADSSNIAYTSFESNGKGTWTFTGSTSTHSSAMTGQKGYSLTGGDITRSGLTSGATYMVSYWKRDSSSTVTVNSNGGTLLNTKNGWKFYSHEITGSSSLTISGTAYIDELRMYPKGALMTTYTYNPLVGVTTNCDANNRITYYEYDSFGRLQYIKDQERKIVKKMAYKYQAGYQQ